MLWVFSGTFICYMPLYTLFLQEISLFVYPSSQLIHGLFLTFIDVPRDSNYISRQRFYRYFEYTNMCSLIKCMVYCIVLSSLGCRFKNSQIVIIFFKHEHLLKVLVKILLVVRDTPYLSEICFPLFIYFWSSVTCFWLW